MGKANSKSWFHKTESMTCTPCSTIAINCHNYERNIVFTWKSWSISLTLCLNKHAQSHKTKQHEVESNMFLRRNRIMNNLIPNKTYLTYIYIWQYDTRDNTSSPIIDTMLIPVRETEIY